MRGAGVADHDGVGAGDDAGQAGEVGRAAEVDAAGAAATSAVSARSPARRSPRPGGRRRPARRRARRCASAPRREPAPRRRDGRRRSSPRPGATARRRHAQPPASPGGSSKPAAAHEVERPLDLVHVVGDAVAQVEQRARVVDRRRRDPRHAGQPQQQRRRQRALVEGAEDDRGVGAAAPPRARRAPRRPRARPGRARGRSTAPASRRPRRRPAAAPPPAARADRTAASRGRRRPRPRGSPARRAARRRRCRAGRRARGSRRRLDRRARRASSGTGSGSPGVPAVEQQVDRAREVGRDLGAAAISSRPRARRRHEHAARAGRPRGLDVGADVADHRAARAGRRPAARPPRRMRPGAGLRQRAAVGRAVRAPLDGPERAEQRLDPALTASTCARVSSPRATPLWLVTTRGPDAGGAQPVERLPRAPGIGSTRAGSPLYGHVDDQRAVAVEQHGSRPRPRRRAAASRRGERRATATSRPRRTASAALVHGHRRDLAARSAGRGDPRERELGGAREPRRAGRGGEPRRRRAATRRGDGQRRPPPRSRGGAGERPRGTPARSRQPRPCRRRMSTSSALPACLRSETAAAGGADRVQDRAAPADDPVAGARQPQAEIGVLAVGAREALVEAADRRRAPSRR